MVLMKNFKDLIGFEDFVKIDMRVGEVMECVVVEKSDKLLKSRVWFGEVDEVGEKICKTCFSGIREWYGVGDLMGRKFGFVVNLEPRSMFGDLSEVMIMAVDSGDGSALLWPCPEDAVIGGVVR